jgi:GntR family transcriptional regulator of arabinose operon
VVGIDNRRAGFVVTHHMIEAGARRIALSAALHFAPSCVGRSNGYRDAVVTATVEMGPPFVEQLDPSDIVKVRFLWSDIIRMG